MKNIQDPATNEKMSNGLEFNASFTEVPPCR